MAFFISDRLHDSFEVMMLARERRTEAVALWAFAGCWSSRHLTGGVLPEALPSHFGQEHFAADLIRVGLWEKHASGYQFVGAQAAYDLAMARPRRPTPYVTLGLCKLPSKAYVDWHKSRGIKPERQPIDGLVRASVLREHGMVCWLCQRPIETPSDVHLDHVVPHSHGGSDEPANLRPAHARCNLLRGTKDPDAFRSNLRDREALS